jgi:hypothetical protein
MSGYRGFARPPGARRTRSVSPVEAVTPPPGMRRGPRGGWVRAVLDDNGQPFRATDPGSPTPEERRRYAQALVDQLGPWGTEPRSPLGRRSHEMN